MGLEKICRTQFWNSSISWDTEDPSFSKCFQNLILVIASCAVLWVIAPFEFIKICKTRLNPTPWTCLSISKLVLKVILLLVCTLDFSLALYSYINIPDNGLDGLIRSASYFITIVLTVIITLMCKSRGMRVSLALPSFWMISTITTIISIYNDIHSLDPETWTTIVSLVDDSISFIISLIQLVMSIIPDRGAHPFGRQQRDRCPLEGSPLQSRISFSWIIGLLRKSEENSLHQDHLIPLCSEQKSALVASQFEKLCNRSSSSQRSPFPESTASNSKKTSLLCMLLKMSQKHIIIASIMEVIFIITYYLPVYLLSVILDEGSKERKWHNYIYSSALFLAILLSSISNSQRKYFGLTGALRIKTSVVNAVFAKALKVSQMPQKIKNLITVDANNIFQGICIMTDLWGSPIRLILGIYILWAFVGASCFVGVLTAFCLIPINILVEHCSLIYQKMADDKKHEMIDMLSECIRGMKVLKMYAWEEFFIEKLMKIRKEEIGKLRKTTGLRIAFKFLFLSSTSIVSLATVTAYVLMENTANVKTIFLSYFIIYLLKTPLKSLLHLFAYFVECLASIKKVQSFLEAEELENLQKLTESNENVAILKNASFSCYGSTESCLQNLSMSIPKRSLIAVVGETRSGKSSLLRALLGEMKKMDGEASVKERIEFITQDSWIQSMPLDKNILFLKDKNNDFYQKTLEACALMNDIESLPAGDETEIGQKGICLSMEQRIKVNIARAIYQDADLYIFDHPFTNLDSLLSEHLYHRIIGRSGILKEKARILLTESEEFLPLVDIILFLKDGRLVEQGSHSQLKERNGYFTEYMQQIHLNSIKEHKPLDNQRKSIENPVEFGNVNDLWSSVAVAPAKIKIEDAVSNEGPHTSKSLGGMLGDYLKMLGLFLAPVIVLVAALASLCEIISGVWLSRWADGVGDGYDAHYNLLIYAGIIFSQLFLTITCGIAMFVSGTMAAEKLHSWVLQIVMRASQMIFETTPINKMIDSFDKDFRYVDEKIPETAYVWLLYVFKVPALLVVIFIASPYLAVGLIPLVYAFIVIQRHYLNTRQQLHHLTSATSCPLSGLLDDTFQGISHIRTSRAVPYFLQRFHTKLDTHNNCLFLFLVVSRWISCILDISTALLVFIATMGAFYEQEQGRSFIVLSIIYVMQLGEVLTALVYTSSQLITDLSPLERIMSFSKLKQESEWEDPANQPTSDWPEHGAIGVNNLSTAYGEGMYPVIHNINFSVTPGEKVAIIGKEESGIYTFLYTLFRLIEPAEGNIIIDNISIQNLGLRDLRSKLGVIPQETIVFKGSLRYNLDPGKIYSDVELQRALETVRLKYGVEFPELDSLVDEQMSTEERNLLSLTRCLLKRPKIVIIDEQEPPDTVGRSVFQESTVLSFAEQPLTDHNGRIIRFLSGELQPEENTKQYQD